MVIFILTDCPPKVRGDLSRLFEINTGVYVGRVSARVREEIGVEFAHQCATAKLLWYMGLLASRKWNFVSITRRGKSWTMMV